VKELEERIDDIYIGRLDHLLDDYDYRLILDQTFSTWNELKNDLYKELIEKLLDKVEKILLRGEDIILDKKIPSFENEVLPGKPWQMLDPNGFGVFDKFKKKPEPQYIEAPLELVVETNRLLVEELGAYKKYIPKPNRTKGKSSISKPAAFRFNGMYATQSFLNKLIDFQFEGGKQNLIFKLFQLSKNKDVAAKQRQDLIELFLCDDVDLWRKAKAREMVSFGMELGAVALLFEEMGKREMVKGDWKQSIFTAKIFCAQRETTITNKDSFEVNKTKFNNKAKNNEEKVKYTIAPLKIAFSQLVEKQTKNP
jgi:hypothetical protein